MKKQIITVLVLAATGFVGLGGTDGSFGSAHFATFSTALLIVSPFCVTHKKRGRAGVQPLVRQPLSVTRMMGSQPQASQSAASRPRFENTPRMSVSFVFFGL